jgi:hypothetical protein
VAWRTCTFSGNQAVLSSRLAPGAGAFTFTGLSARLVASLAGATGGYAVSWQTFSDTASIACHAGSFALTGPGAYLSYELVGGGGDRIAGGQFSRRRWRELEDAIAAERNAQAQARALADERKRAAARKAAAAAKAARRAAWRAQDRSNAEAANVRLLADAQRALSAGQAFNDTLRSAAAIAAAAREVQAQAQARSAALNDEDEAIVLLLLAA